MRLWGVMDVSESSLHKPKAKPTKPQEPKRTCGTIYEETLSGSDHLQRAKLFRPQVRDGLKTYLLITRLKDVPSLFAVYFSINPHHVISEPHSGVKSNSGLKLGMGVEIANK